MNVYQEILIKENDMIYVKERLEKLLKIKFEEHESSYLGVYYISKNVEKISSIKIVNNFIDEDWQYVEYKDCPIIISLNDVEDEDDVLKQILLNENFVEKVLISEVESGKYSRKYMYEDGKKILISEHSLYKRS